MGRCGECVCVEVWSFGGLGGVVCSVPPPTPPGYMLEVDSRKRPHAVCTHV